MIGLLTYIFFRTLNIAVYKAVFIYSIISHICIIMSLKIVKYPLWTQVKIWLIFWVMAASLLIPILALIIQSIGLKRWGATPVWFKAAAISLPMVIFMPPLGEWITRKITGQED